MRAFRLAPLAAVCLLSLVVASPALATHDRPKAASPFYVPFVPSFQPCPPGAGTTVHVAPLSVSSCVPVLSSRNLWVGTPDVVGMNVAAANEVGRVIFTTGGGINFLLNDVRCQPPLPLSLCPPMNVNGSAQPTPNDYIGEIEETHVLRITDHSNGPPGGPYTQAGTLTDVSIPFTVQCTGTANQSIGSTCSLVTNYNSIIPGVIVAGKRAVWEHGQVQVNDGGPDGVVSTVPNDLFQVQGVFHP